MFKKSAQKRQQKELKTIAAMTRIYCRDVHGCNSGLCSKCEDLLQYAEKRLKNCPFAEKKNVCSKCTIHCYKKSMKTQVKEVMRHSGPRMLKKHPIMALQHLLDSLRKPPEEKNE